MATSRHPQFVLNERLLLLEHLRAAARLAEHDAWRDYHKKIEDMRWSHLEVLATDLQCNIDYERGVIAVLSTLRAAMQPSPKMIQQLENEVGALRKKVQDMQDAGLSTDSNKDTP